MIMEYYNKVKHVIMGVRKGVQQSVNQMKVINVLEYKDKNQCAIQHVEIKSKSDKKNVIMATN